MTPRDRLPAAIEAAKDLESKPRGTRKACTFRQRDLAAALRALKQTGHEVSQVRVDPDGKICIVTGAPEPAEPVAEKTAPPKQVWLDLARKRS